MKHSRAAALFLLPLLIGFASPAGDQKSSDAPKSDRVDVHGDPLPAGVLARMGTIRFRHGAQIQYLQYSKDGKVLASLGVDQTIRLWDSNSGKELQVIPAPEANNAVFALSPDGKYVATTNFARIRIWDAKTGKELHAIDDPNGNATAVAFSPDGKTLAATSGADDIQFIDVATGKETKRLKGPQNQGNQGFYHQQISFSADGTQLAVAGFRDNKNVVDLLPVGGGARVSSLDLQQQAPFQMFGPDHKTMAIWGIDQDLHIVDMKTGKDIHKFNMQQGVISMAYSQDGKHLAACAGNNAFVIWDVATGKEVNPEEMPKTPVTIMAFSPDGKTIAVGGGTGSIIRQLDLKKGKDIQQTGGHAGCVLQVVLSQDGKTLASIGEDHTVRLWDVATAKEIRRIEGPGGDQPGVQLGGTVEFSNDGKLLAVGWINQSLVLYDASNGKEVHTFAEKDNPNPIGVTSIAFTADGKSVATACADGIVRFWSLDKDHKVLRRYPENAEGPNPNQPNPPDVIDAGMFMLALSPDGKLMVTLGTDASDGINVYSVLRVWELATGKERQKMRFKDQNDGGGIWKEGLRFGGIGGGGARAILDVYGQGGASSAMVVSPDGRYVALTSGATVRLVDLVKGKEIRQFGAQGEGLSGAMFSPDGKTLAAGAADGTVRLWEVATGTALGEFHGHRGAVTALVYAPNGKTLATGGVDTTAMVWDVPYLLDSLKVNRAPLAKPDLEELAKDLSGEDSQKAGIAIWKLVDAPKESLPFLKERLKPVDASDEKKIAQLIKDLASDEFEVRKKATEDLEALGELAEPALRKRLDERPELEVQTRIEELLEKLQKPVTSPELLSMIRMIEVLEHIGNADAKKMLLDLSKGAEGARITREAKLAAERLAKR